MLRECGLFPAGHLHRNIKETQGMHRDWLKVNSGFLPPQRGNTRRYIGTKQGYHLNYRHLTVLSNTNPRESSLVENRALLGTLCLSRLHQNRAQLNRA